MATPVRNKSRSERKGSARPAIQICNRCIPHLNADLDAANPCNGSFGLMATKCARCARARHACVAVEPPLYGDLQAVVNARDELALATREGREDELEDLRQVAIDLGNDLTRNLRILDRNRNKATGDRPTPRKERAAAAPAGSNSAQLLELQSIRRGILALVEVGKGLLRDRFVGQEAIDAIDEALGPDAPAGAFASTSPSRSPSAAPRKRKRPSGEEGDAISLPEEDEEDEDEE